MPLVFAVVSFVLYYNDEIIHVMIIKFLHMIVINYKMPENN